jgi:polysaccharide export outer membrane protein
MQPPNVLDSMAYGQPGYAQPGYAQPTYAAPAAQPGLFTSHRVVAAPVATMQPPNVLDSMAYGQPGYAQSGSAQPESAQPTYAAPAAPRGLFTSRRVAASRGGVAAPVAYAEPAPAPIPVAAYDSQYRLDAGDKLRVVVYGQEGLTNTYAIDAGGAITLPLIGSVVARGMTPAGLAASITARLRNGYIREPSVAVEIESYRPFFILGEVAAPGQYPYVPNMSVESAVAIAGGFAPRARRDAVTLTHTDQRGSIRAVVPLGTPLSPGDTVLVGERWF